MTTPALKNCPFCNNIPSIEYNYILPYRETAFDNPQGYFIFCTKCGCEQCTTCEEDYEGKLEAIEKWNTRPTPQIDREKIHKLINEVIADKIGYLKDEMGIFQDIEDAIIKALPELGG